ncbi:hypothetical protein FACS1894193_09060 [Bacilli bacterium]|nr:hypothetical protein FACS1894192_08280 [Bacilli bacterium]GHU42930.1 hypothetical protein FACS1894193_09060 [Bacilli bacterium]
MKMKPIISLTGLALGVSLLARPALADTNTTGSWGTGDGNTDVTVLVPATYSVEIPAVFNFTTTGEQGTATDIAIASTSQIETDAILSVKLTSTNTLQAVKTYNGGANTSVVPFTVAYGSNKTAYTSGNETTILSKTGAEIGASSTDLSTGVYVTVGSFANATTAGIHSGTLTFSVGYTAGTP